MVMGEEFRGGNGHNKLADLPEETEGELNEAAKKLSALTGQDGQLFSSSKETLSLLKQFTHPPEFPGSGDDPFIQMSLILDFEDDEERQLVVAAYFEAVELGMDIRWNVVDALTRSATNRPNGFMSRVRLIAETLSHSKFTTNVQPDKGYARGKSNSPLSG